MLEVADTVLFNWLLLMLCVIKDVNHWWELLFNSSFFFFFTPINFRNHLDVFTFLAELLFLATFRVAGVLILTCFQNLIRRKDKTPPTHMVGG